MIIWKVVSEKNGVLYSVSIISWPKVIYKLKKYVKAYKEVAKKGYHLIAFDTLENATNFVNYLSPGGISIYSYKIFKARGRNRIRNLPKRCNSLYLLEKKLVTIETPWPKGTVMFKKIKLLEEIKI